MNSGPTIDRLLTEGWIWNHQRTEFAQVADLRFLGRRLGEVPPVMQTGSRHEWRFAQKTRETRLLGHALVGAGELVADIKPRERPDFEVKLPSRSILVEVAELNAPDSARWSNTMAKMTLAVRDAVDLDPALKGALGDHYLTIIFNECPTSAKARNAIAEILAFVRTRGFETVPRDCLWPVNELYQTLASHRVLVSISHIKGGMIDVRSSATSFDPFALVPIAGSVLARKRAHTYDVQPEWLVLGATDQTGDYRASMDYLSRICPVIDPFESVIVNGEGRTVIWMRDGIVARAS